MDAETSPSRRGVGDLTFIMKARVIPGGAGRASQRRPKPRQRLGEFGRRSGGAGRIGKSIHVHDLEGQGRLSFRENRAGGAWRAQPFGM
ncbi:hypothetical protein GJ654_05340 [Rhodoblastus acidophilus]|uniref:Uncharacterized protein n=1 Tax=Rhodoblastus acidophilus TaxID=1074 RepID=A0A6N8DMH2_RHOAC|nr:hypothetical protein [Rhodoblastus acidophilus]MCW2273500.1 hypothetical protein [Rhodoblastus acidophilus]MTV30413.1 hypothetical protein [Rhodoblastus acidophilus]